jgi:hypothetical protein
MNKTAHIERLLLVRRQEVIPEQQAEPIRKLRIEGGAAQIELERVVAGWVLAEQLRVGVIDPIDRLPVDEFPAPVPVRLALTIGQDYLHLA